MAQTKRTFSSLEQVVSFVLEQSAKGTPVFVRYSRGAASDKRMGGRSLNHATGQREGGLSVNNLVPQDGIPKEREDAKKFVAQQLRDYSFIFFGSGGQQFPWLLTGEVVGRGGDNEPLVTNVRDLGKVHSNVIKESIDLLDQGLSLDEQSLVDRIMRDMSFREPRVNRQFSKREILKLHNDGLIVKTPLGFNVSSELKERLLKGAEVGKPDRKTRDNTFRRRRGL